MEEKMKVLFGMNYKTTITGIFTVISLIPEAILYLGLAEIPQWLRIVSLCCVFLSYLYGAYQAKDKDVSGVGPNTYRL